MSEYLSDAIRVVRSIGLGRGSAFQRRASKTSFERRSCSRGSAAGGRGLRNRGPVEFGARTRPHAGIPDGQRLRPFEVIKERDLFPTARYEGATMRPRLD